jgi:hypothetical protein
VAAHCHGPREAISSWSLSFLRCPEYTYGSAGALQDYEFHAAPALL